MLTLLGGAPYQPLDNSGRIVPGGLLTFRVAGSDELQDTYTDSDGGTVATNPVELDAYGRASIYLGTDAAYDIDFTDADALPIWTQTDVIANAAAT